MFRIIDFVQGFFKLGQPPPRPAGSQQQFHRRALCEADFTHGDYAKFRELDREWLPTWLQKVGYNTLYTGKFIVDYTIRKYDPPPSDWTVFDALVHPFIFEY